jgi:aldose 1-epimerase
MKISAKPFGTLPDGAAVTYFTIANDSGLKIGLINFGATLVSLEVHDRAGKLDDVILGFDSLEGYVAHNAPHFGGICGRVANRIAKGKFTLDGQAYQLAINNGPNHLHGGLKGFDAVLWQAEPQPGGVKFSYLSEEGEENYPGNLRVEVTYSLTNDNALVIRYSATTDKPTILNLTNHAYFNLAGHNAGSMLDHELTINAGQRTLTDADLIPTGKIADVAGAPFDFRAPHKIGERIEAAGGYDLNYIIAGQPCARVVEPGSGRVMEMRTTEPAVQFYTGNFLGGERGKTGVVYCKHGGFCLEAQHYPDSINHPEFPTTVLRPGQTYRQETSYWFSVL